jgi:outer membrane lipoprotein LolB
VNPARRDLARRGAVLALAALAGCASIPRDQSNLGGETLAGRLSVRVEADGSEPARALNAAFELRGDPARGRLDLATPFGNVLAQARWSPSQVVLATPSGETQFADLESLTRKVLGESVPVAALFDWLHGRPWPGAPSRPVPEVPGFEQLGWSVNLASFDEDLLSAKRDSRPPVTLRVKLDRP